MVAPFSKKEQKFLRRLEGNFSILHRKPTKNLLLFRILLSISLCLFFFFFLRKTISLYFYLLQLFYLPI